MNTIGCHRNAIGDYEERIIANGKTHLMVGAGVGSCIYCLFCWLSGRKFSWAELVAATAVGGIAGITPDILEPATNPNHRKFFHSVTTLALIGFGTHRALENPELTSGERISLLVPAAGYVSHLLLDGTTPRSLPPY